MTHKVKTAMFILLVAIGVAIGFFVIFNSDSFENEEIDFSENVIQLETYTELNTTQIDTDIIKTFPKGEVENIFVSAGKTHESKNTETTLIISKESATRKTTVVEVTKNSSSNSDVIITDIMDIVQYPLNLNTATSEELQTLPKIGSVIAERIISYREANGGFKNREELLSISGIGEAIYSEIFNMVYLDVEYFTEPLESDVIDENISTETAVETVLQTTEIPHLDINKAEKDDFMRIPGIDEKLAESIIELREKIHKFQNVRELLLIEGMTNKKLVSIWDYLYIEDDTNVG
ncbi:MAG: helix-hairpin-helix domain-containing protein [Ruminococcus sp.]|nr:helix-hairpin-helix domain-containing protein [Ruminococcus sp.]